MPKVITIYNCGTNYDRNMTDVVGKLWRNTASDCYITDGVGSPRKKSADLDKKFKEKFAQGGTIFGVGVNGNVARAVEYVEEYDDDIQENYLSINMCGWSRGAVTCYKIANALMAHGDPKYRVIPIRIFAIDPVPGSAGKMNKHMWKDIALTDNVKATYTIYAEYDRRRTFSPVINREMSMWDIHCTMKEWGRDDSFRFDTMPGNHAGIVEDKGDAADASNLVGDMALRFLKKNGTRFNDPTVLRSQDYLAKYSNIMLNLETYKHDVGQSRIPGYGLSGKRTPRMQDEKGKKFRGFEWPSDRAKTNNRVRFWANRQHEQLFLRRFSALHALIDRSRSTLYVPDPNAILEFKLMDEDTGEKPTVVQRHIYQYFRVAFGCDLGPYL